MFTSGLTVIATADREVETLAIKLMGTFSLIKALSVKRKGGQRQGAALMAASCAASTYNRIQFHDKPHTTQDRKRRIPIPRRAKRLVPMIRPHLRGIETFE